jgi:hypothetical protein
MRSPSVIEISGIVGTVVAELFGPDGELKARCEGHNLITQYGDQVVTERAAGIAGLSAPTGMRIGTGSTAAAKTGAGAAIVTKITGGNKAFDATYPQSSQNGAARRITWKTTYNAGEGTTALNITEVVLVNDTIATDTATPATGTVARFVLTGLGVKGANDTLALTWTWDHQGV